MAKKAAEKKTPAKKAKAEAAPKKSAGKKVVGAKTSSKADEFRSHSADELGDRLAGLKKEHFNLRFQQANGQLENTGRFRVVRREIARIQTVLTEQRARARAQG